MAKDEDLLGKLLSVVRDHYGDKYDYDEVMDVLASLAVSAFHMRSAGDKDMCYVYATDFCEAIEFILADGPSFEELSKPLSS